MPYHDRRMAHGHERATNLRPNIGLTLQANRQAVQDARRCLHWLEQQGYTKLGILAPASALRSATSLSSTMNVSALAASSTFPPTMPTSSAKE